MLIYKPPRPRPAVGPPECGMKKQQQLSYCQFEQLNYSNEIHIYKPCHGPDPPRPEPPFVPPPPPPPPPPAPRPLPLDAVKE